MNGKADYVFEISWEVCNKVGGIYTVLESKAALMKENYKNYILIGPYFPDKAKFEFLEKEIPEHFKKTFTQLNNQGIICKYGSWLVKGEPDVILLDFQGYIKEKNSLKEKYWNNFKIDSLYTQWEFEEPMIWSTTVGKLLELFTQINKSTIVAHCHEWLAGFTLLYLKMNKIKIGTVFTTHATMLGRVLAASGSDFYSKMETINPLDEAKKNGILDKHTTELACAQNADVFTTVSEITAIEAEKLLGRKADILVLNGLDIGRFPSFEETSVKHQLNREIIREFISYYFLPYYYFDPEETLTFFIVGRYEYKNKGIDIFIKSLSQLNERMKKENSKKTIVVFFWIPRDVLSAKASLAKNKSNYHHVRDFIDDNIKTTQSRIMENIMICDKASCFTDEKNFYQHQLFDKEFLSNVRRLRLNFSSVGKPPLTTHDLVNEQEDLIIKSFLEQGLDNSTENKVKVIFYPVYLSGIDGLIDLPYYDAIMGCHLGLFPSYYEPWGYTPLESAALGVPSLTTDLGGFGRFVLSQHKGDSGVFVLKRYQRTEEETINSFTDILHNFSKLDRKGRVDQKLYAKQISNLADWKVFIKNYLEAHTLALQRVYG